MRNYIPPHAICYYDASVTLGLDAKEFDSRLAALETKIASSTKTMSSSFSGVGKGLAGSLLSVGAIAAAAKGVAEYGARVYDLSQRFGVSTDAIQHFGNAAEKNGSSLEAMTMGFNKLAVARSKALEGDQELIGSFQRLGISMVDLQKLKPEELMKKLGASSLNAAETVKILGKNGLELRPTLAGIADGTIEIGDAINGIDIEQLKKADTEWKKLTETLKIIGGELLGGLIPALEKAGETAYHALDKVKGLFSESAKYVPDSADMAGVPGFGGKPGESGSVGPGSGEEAIKNDARKTAAQKAAILAGGTVPPPSGQPSGKRDFSHEVDESAMRRTEATKLRTEATKLTLGELAARGDQPFEQGAFYRGKYVGGDVAKAREAQREKGLMDDALFAGNDDEAAVHKGRYESLTKGIGSLKESEKDPLAQEMKDANDKLEKIETNTAKPFVNH